MLKQEDGVRDLVGDPQRVQPLLLRQGLLVRDGPLADTQVHKPQLAAVHVPLPLARSPPISCWQLYGRSGEGSGAAADRAE